jgi:hypothetical protein
LLLLLFSSFLMTIVKPIMGINSLNSRYYSKK